MLLSMTGHGQGVSSTGDLNVAAEVRTINNRYLKVSVRSNENSLSVEPRIESLLKRTIRRGTVQVNLRIDRQVDPENYRLNLQVLKSYRDQLVKHQLITDSEFHLNSLLLLPGVVQEFAPAALEAEDAWQTIEQAVLRAMESLQKMRQQEGASMEKDLQANCQSIGEMLDQIEVLAPKVIEAYEQRLTDRLQQIQEKHQLDLQPTEIVREIGLFADRCDVSEEVVRIRSHLEQFKAIMKDKESNGRKLDFLAQELFREVNTIGSKANDADIARQVVEIKTIVERIREMVQNVE